MAEKEQAINPVPDFTVKRRRRKQTIAKRATSKKRLDLARSITRVNISLAFPHWRELRDLKLYCRISQY